jgi:hypothetical protein
MGIGTTNSGINLTVFEEAYQIVNQPGITVNLKMVENGFRAV